MLSDLIIVIVNWNLKDDTIACIDSLLAAGASCHQIVLVDNGSEDGSVSAFQECYSHQLNLITNPKNLGFTQASNQGIEYALQAGASWILILNNDTIVAEDFFDQIHRVINSQQEYAIISPIILYYSKPERIWSLGDRLVPGTLITINPYHNKTLPKHYPELIPVDFVAGCAMFIRRDVFKTIGLFDTSLVMYGEEVDLCWRARLSGYKIASAPRAKMWHKISMSADRVRVQTRYLRIRNQIRFYRKYSHGVQRLIMFFFTIVRVLFLLSRDIFNKQIGLIRPAIQGWFDGWCGT